jgi:DNA-binding LacI/PurR family transcriptional regulator
MSIVGFDDFDWIFALRPYLTTVAHAVEDFAAAWLPLMMRLSEGRGKGVERVELPCTLKLRISTGPARSRLKAVAGAAELLAQASGLMAD